jgi:hypothetical protein
MLVAVAVVAPSDPLLDQRRIDCVSKIAQWLRRGDRASVLSITCFGDRSASGLPDRAYNAVALEADLFTAIARLPALMCVACTISKDTSRDDRQWFRAVAAQMLRSTVRGDWVEWIDAVEHAHGMGARPFERLLDASADCMAEDLGSEFWG